MVSSELNSRQVILPFLGVMVALSVALQIAIALADHEIGPVAWVATLAVALVYLWYHVTHGDRWSQIRFGRLVAHVCGFLAVNLGFHVHAALLVLANSPAIRGNADFPIADQWFGVLFGMFVIWGVGLLVHVTASITARGFEDLRA